MKPFVPQILSVCAAALVTTAPLNAQNPQKAPSAQAQQAPKVDVYHVPSPQPLGVTFTYPARLSAYQSAVVTSRVTGVLTQKLYTEGSFVKKGQNLYRIEPDAYAALVNERNADVEVQQAALTNAQRDWDRVKNLYANNAISQKEYDAVLSVFEQAKANLASAKARLNSAKIDLDYTHVRAPISGIAGMKQTDTGNVVSPGTALVTITQVDPIYAEFSVPDADLYKAGRPLQQIAKSGKLKVALAHNGITYSGSVDYADPLINTKTGSVKFRALLSNPKRTLIPGTFGRISLLDIQTDPVISVPQKAVLQNKMGTIVMVVENGVVGIRPIKLGKKMGDGFIVEGLKGGEKVIVNNFFRIKPGASVAIDKVVNAKGK